MHDNKQVVERALQLGASVQQSPITHDDLVTLGAQGCEALVVASYSWKIPQWSPFLKYAVNFHPSPLPEARGPYPLIRAILEDRSSWSVSCHKISEKFDHGDILDAEIFCIDTDECHESLFVKSQMAAGRLAERIAGDCAALWQAARPQVGGSYWPRWTEADRSLDLTQPVEMIMRKIRAFGDLECMATINDTVIFIHRARAWTEAHTAVPGKLVHASDLMMLVAVKDGFLFISEWSFNPPGATACRLRR